MREASASEKRNSIFTDVVVYFISLLQYLLLRFRQVSIYTWAFLVLVFQFAGDLKENIVRRMFWGRSTFYRSAFQFSIGFLTISIALWGLAGRINLFSSEANQVLAFPTEHIGDADYIHESSSIQAIVSNNSLTRGYNVQEYVVQKGDSIESIANKFGISKETIMWANSIQNENFLKIGEKLEILPINGVIHSVEEGDSLSSIAEKYDASVQDIYDINWLESKVLKTGQELLVPNGKMPQPKPVITTTPTYAAAPITPPPPIPGGGIASGSFVRPCGCGGITNWYSAWHQGIDIAQSGGCTINAIDGGVVTMARWYGAGGLQIMINHGNGFISLYAHNSAIYVKEGQQVAKGQAIGYMGCTGRCTGTHIHFGLQLNGYWVNPLSYVPV